MNPETCTKPEFKAWRKKKIIEAADYAIALVKQRMTPGAAMLRASYEYPVSVTEIAQEWGWRSAQARKYRRERGEQEVKDEAQTTIN